MKIYLQSSELIQFWMQSVKNADKVTSVIFVHKALNWAIYHVIPEHSWIMQSLLEMIKSIYLLSNTSLTWSFMWLAKYKQLYEVVTKQGHRIQD